MEIQQWTCPILVIDDDNDLCDILEVIIRKHCPVHFEHDLKSAGNYLTKVKPEIIFLDNNLPDGIGLLYIKTILHFCPDVKIILMTSDQSIGIKELAMEEGATNFIEKPFKARMINEMILEICPNLRAA